MRKAEAEAAAEAAKKAELARVKAEIQKMKMEVRAAQGTSMGTSAGKPIHAYYSFMPWPS